MKGHKILRVCYSNLQKNNPLKIPKLLMVKLTNPKIHFVNPTISVVPIPCNIPVFHFVNFQRNLSKFKILPKIHAFLIKNGLLFHIPQRWFHFLWQNRGLRIPMGDSIDPETVRIIGS